MKKYLLLFTALFLFSTIRAQQPAPNPIDSIYFFIGDWEGKGAFANGKEIEATASFRLSLDSSWIVYEHADKAPNRYKSTSMWGTDGSTGNFIAVAFDNFHGQRKFESGGWKNNRIVITTAFSSKGVFNYQHFIYEKLSEDSFKMTYEVSKDCIAWRMGDWLVFKRK